MKFAEWFSVRVYESAVGYVKYRVELVEIDYIELAVMYRTGKGSPSNPWRLKFAIIDLEDNVRSNPKRRSSIQYPEANREHINNGEGWMPLGIARVEEGSDIKYVFFSMEIGTNDG